MKIIVSAPGKLHLMGEHAVVYGKPALLAAVSQRLFVTLNSFQGLEMLEIPKQVRSDAQFLQTTREKDKYFNFICETVEKHFSAKIPDDSISISSTIPK